MSDRLAEVMAARTPGRWTVEPRDEARWFATSDEGLNVYSDSRDLPNRRAIVTAVNLWDAHEAIRAAAAPEHESSYHRSMAPKCATCLALAAFDERAKEVVG